MENTERIKEVVRDVLKEDAKSRNSDTWLIINVLRRMGFKIYINYEDLDSMPSLESITRARRVIQNNEGEFLPSPDVDEQRTKRREECREIYKNTQLSWD